MFGREKKPPYRTSVGSASESDSGSFPWTFALVGGSCGALLIWAFERGSLSQRSLRQNAEKLGALAGQTVQGLRQSAQEVPRRTTDLKNQAQSGLSDLESDLDRKLRDHPLPFGMAAAALGAALGLLLPQSTREKEVMGPARNRLLKHLKSRVNQTVKGFKSAVTKAVEKDPGSDRPVDAAARKQATY